MTSDELYGRLLTFAQRSIDLVKKLPKTVYNMEHGRQLTRSSGSPGANYIEAIEGSSKKEFINRLVICRKESKESMHWLRLVRYANADYEEIVSECDLLIKEAGEFVKIFNSAILTSKRNAK